MDPVASAANGWSLPPNSTVTLSDDLPSGSPGCTQPLVTSRRHAANFMVASTHANKGKPRATPPAPKPQQFSVPADDYPTFTVGNQSPPETGAFTAVSSRKSSATAGVFAV